MGPHASARSCFRTVLVANRGEIACRVIRTARAQGYRTVAIYSEADAGALHTRMADLATCVGPPPVRASYLAIDAIVEAARRTGAEAVHPGYGFLSENDAFAAACEAAGLVFIGPSPFAIRSMGNKAAAKRLMIEAGVPTIPGWQGAGPDDQREETIAEAAEAIGYPVLIKAAAGGGGRGMRLVRARDEFLPSLRTARAEAESAFGSGEVLLEKALLDARHVEIQVFGDSLGNVVHLGERDCSVQRRHQKIVEEAPSPVVDEGLRARMGAAAVQAARRIDYVGAGTVEFLLDADGAFYFLEMNTRLQVEHPVTEYVTGLDLVALQLEVAQGRPLPLRQEDVRLAGHAIEVRLYAEDPYAGFLPQTGQVLAWEPGGDEAGDRAKAGMRVDHGLIAGRPIAAEYDPMLAKLVAHGPDREAARRRILRLLEDTTLLGTTTNKRFLHQVLSHAAFAAGAATTRFIPQHLVEPGHETPTRPAPPAWLPFAAVALRSLGDRAVLAPPMPPCSPDTAFTLELSVEGDEGATPIAATVRTETERRLAIAIAGVTKPVALVAIEEARARLAIDGVERWVAFASDGERLFVDFGEGALGVVERAATGRRRREARGGDGRVLAAMNGRIVSVPARPGAQVARGEIVVVLEAMKMQHPIAADVDGTIAEVLVAEGDQVATRRLLVRIEPRANE